ncbi:PAS domain-containing sensor histidine kinase [Arthrobacter sp. Helios]|uniref:sensor histidine kinase n=1 Tax=Arthrobacter sp. Helios TaxID=2828862 RepID=UPI002045FA06|nr:PAS domain-containing sensor histidine kinase [Arthrobacter sp. Helios]UPO77635.1 PAS domain-containing sensor histidine kinase [Arthrobacter sp. Helios]
MSRFKDATLSSLGKRRDFYLFALRDRVALSQSPLVVAVVVLLPIVFVAKPEAYSNPEFLTGLGLITVLSILSVSVPWDRCFKRAYLLVPLLDFGAIALLYRGVRPDVPGVAALAVFPVLWLAWSAVAPRLAALAAFSGALLIAWAPLFGTDPEPADLLAPALVPLVMLLMYLAAAITVQDATGQQQALEEKDRELKRSLQDSRRRAQLLDAVQDTIDVGVVVLARDGHIMLMNNRQLATHQLSVPADTDGEDEADMLLFEQDGCTPLPAADRPMARALRREAYSGSLMWVGRGAEQRAMAVSARPLNDEDGEFNGSVLAFSDVTDMLRALRAKEDFVASVSHELRTPLTSIIGYLDLAISDAEDEGLSESLQGSLSVALRNAERLLVLVADLLTTASDSIYLEAGELSLRDLARSAADSAGPRADAAGIRLVVDAPADVRGVFDSTRIQQVLDNLVSNAIKYSPGGGTVTLRVLSGEASVVLEVEDEGMGMSDAEQGEVYNRFFRAAAVKKAGIPGVGLGLGITKDIVAAHGGTICLTSQPGAGTTFRVELPLKKTAGR